MSYRNQYSGSPWQQGGPPFGVGGYSQSYGGYGVNDQYGVSHQMMNSGYGRNQSSYGSMYGGMNQMRNMGYGPSRHYVNDRMGGRQGSPRGGQMQRKRLPQRSPAGGPRSKRPNLDNDNRRMRMKQRRRGSRGGSKGRGRNHSDDEKGDEPYNPAEPTDDASDTNYDDYDSWKSSSEDENEKKGESIAHNGDDQGAPAISEDKDKPEKTDILEKDKSVSKKPLVCHVCKITCSTSERFRKHMNGRTHRSKMETLLALQREKKQVLEASTKASQPLESRDSSKKSSRKPGNWCTVCECSFTGNFLAHRRTKEHRKKRDKKYPKCRPCRLGFSSSEEYREHCKQEDHKLKSAEFHYLKNLASGSDDDEAATEPIKIEESEDLKQEDDATKTEITEEKESKVEEETENKEKDKSPEDTPEDIGDGVAEKKKEKKSDVGDKSSELKKPEKPKEPRAVGQSFVVSVQGYYCKLCHKFFKDMNVAKIKHCRSVMHNQALKCACSFCEKKYKKYSCKYDHKIEKAMEEAFQQEEERQKLADEQDKLEREAAEATRLAAEIAAVEKAAKEAARREAAEKKASQKTKDVEAKEVDEGETGNNVESETKNDTPEETIMDKSTEKTASTINGLSEKVEISVKPVVVEKVEDPEIVAVVEEKPIEGIQSDSQGDEDVEEEPEKVVKEETTSSPVTRRGRGRGRGQSRGKGKRR